MIDFSVLLNRIEENDIITIFGHAAPDGDCYGSQIGLRELLRQAYPDKKVYAVGTGIPVFFERLAPMDIVDEETIASSLAILVDVSCLRRVEDPRVYKAKECGKIDHHQPSPLEEFVGAAVVDTTRIAAAEIVAELALSQGWKISTLAAEAIYLGIYTDSGRLTYRGTTQRTLEIVDLLKKRGMHVRSIQKIAYYETPEVRKVKASIRRKAKLYNTVCYCFLPEESFKKHGLSPQNALRLVNTLATVHKEANSYVLFVPFGEDEVNVELRSNKGYCVHQTAKEFGGGGHRFASGCTIYLSKNSVEDVVKHLDLAEKTEDDNAA